MRTTVKAHLPGDTRNLATPYVSGHEKRKNDDWKSRKNPKFSGDAETWLESSSSRNLTVSAASTMRVVMRNKEKEKGFLCWLFKEFRELEQLFLLIYTKAPKTLEASQETNLVYVWSKCYLLCLTCAGCNTHIGHRRPGQRGWVKSALFSGRRSFSQAGYCQLGCCRCLSTFGANRAPHQRHDVPNSIRSLWKSEGSGGGGTTPSLIPGADSRDSSLQKLLRNVCGRHERRSVNTIHSFRPCRNDLLIHCQTSYGRTLWGFQIFNSKSQ